MKTMDELAAMQPKELAANLREALIEAENITAVLRRRGWYVWINDSNGRVVEPSLTAEIKRTVSTEEEL